MIGVIVREGVRVRWIGGVANKATSGVGIQADEKEERQVMSVPERLEALVADFVMRSRIHEQHDEKHEVPGDTARLGVVNIESRLRTSLCFQRQIEVQTESVEEAPRSRSTLMKFCRDA